MNNGLETSGNKAPLSSRLFQFFPYILTAFAFAIVYARALAFVTIEGDDAASFAYHAMGRDPSLQPPYSPYHGMMDVLLSPLPSDEPIVRIVGITISALCALLLVLLVLKLIRDILPVNDPRQLLVVTVAILLSTPEIFYLGLIFTPSIVAMCCVVGSHLIVRRECEFYSNSRVATMRTYILVGISAMLFGLGVGIRWDIGIYLVFILVDLVVLGSFRHSMRVIISWPILAFLFSLLAILLSGYGIDDVQKVFRLAQEEVTSSDSWFATLGAFQTLLTPGFVALFLVGLISFLFLRNWRLLLVILIGIAPVLPYFFSREPKMVLPALPAMWLVIAAGSIAVWFGKWRFTMVSRILVIVILLGPWLVGIQVYSSDTSWGPGFVVRTPESSATSHKLDTQLQDQVAGRSVSVANTAVGLDGGFAVPTPEGPRPLGGHAYVLLGGEWREFAISRDIERTNAVELARKNNLPILQDGGASTLAMKLLQMGSETTDSKLEFGSDAVNQRRFHDRHGGVILLQSLRVRKSLFDPEQISALAKNNPTNKVILFCGYSSTVNKIMNTAPEAVLQVLGPFSLVIDLDAFQSALLEKEHS